MTTPEQAEPSIDALLASLDTMMSQREILGESVVAPVIEEISDRILARAEAPTEDQSKIAQSWLDLVETSTQLGITPPKPTDEISQALETVRGYESIMAKLGMIGLTQTVDHAVSDDAKTPATDTAEPVAPPTSTAQEQPAPSAQDIKQHDNGPEAAQEQVEYRSLNELVVTDGIQEVRPKASIRQMYVDILKALTDSPEQEIRTSEFVTKIAGASAAEIALAKQGKIKLDPSIDLDRASAISSQFYSALKRLREKGFVEHEKGNTSKESGMPKPGIVRLKTPAVFTETEDGKLTIEIQPAPYHVVVNEYEQSIDNGRGKVVRIDNKEPQVFRSGVRALGVIATRSANEQSKFARKDITRWLEEDGGPSERATTSLSAILDRFGPELPISRSGKGAGVRYSFIPGSTIEVSDGWPEKPDFEEPIYVSVKNNMIEVTVDGRTYSAIDYNDGRVAGGIYIQGRTNELTARYRAMMSALSLLTEPKDQISAEDLGSIVTPSGTPDHKDITIWITRRLNSLNELLSEHGKVVNVRKLGGPLTIDLNRKIVMLDDEQDSGSLPQDQAILQASVPEEVSINLRTPESPTADEGRPVAPRKSADSIAEGVDELDDLQKKKIAGLLIHNSRFEYPTSLEEAAYLLELVMDDGFMGQLRESGRFASQTDATEFRNFKAQILTACYFRTLSWGKFEDLVRAVESRSENKTDSTAFSNILSFSREAGSGVAQIGRSEEERQQQKQANAIYIEKALEGMVDGGTIPRPTSPAQAIELLHSLRINRSAIAEGKTQSEFDKIVQEIHSYSSQILGYGNARTITRGQEMPRIRSRNGGRATQFSGREDHSNFDRTDGRRFPDRGHRKRRSSRKNR